jgi:hypothetical protein
VIIEELNSNNIIVHPHLKDKHESRKNLPFLQQIIKQIIKDSKI